MSQDDMKRGWRAKEKIASNHHSNGNIDLAKEGLKDIQITFEKINHVIMQYS